MGEEVQFEALPEGRLVDLADAALPGRAGVGDEDVDPPELRDRFVDGVLAEPGVGEIAGKQQRASPLALDRAPRLVGIGLLFLIMLPLQMLKR